MNSLLAEEQLNKLHIGERIKLLRVSQNRTVQEIAEACDLSKSMISKIENNKAVPSVAALVKIAKSLGTTISCLLEQGGFLSAIRVTKKEALENLTPTNKGYSIHPYAVGYPAKKMQPFLFVAKKSEVIPHELSHEGEEFIYVIKGQMKVQLGETAYLLNVGDSLYFNSIQKHGIVPVSEVVTYLDIFV